MQSWSLTVIRIHTKGCPSQVSQNMNACQRGHEAAKARRHSIYIQALFKPKTKSCCYGNRDQSPTHRLVENTWSRSRSIPIDNWLVFLTSLWWVYLATQSFTASICHFTAELRSPDIMSTQHLYAGSSLPPIPNSTFDLNPAPLSNIPTSLDPTYQMPTHTTSQDCSQHTFFWKNPQSVLAAAG